MFLIITASPNKNGLTAACGKAALTGIVNGGGEGRIIDICANKLEPCRTCGDGWGTCLDASVCVIKDGFANLQKEFIESEGVILITPVYFHQPSEPMKYFLDRLRRCESHYKGGSGLAGKQVDLIAAAGGSGDGTIPCLAEMEIWCRQMDAAPKDRIGITNYNRPFMLEAITDAAFRLVKGMYYTDN